jgi:hypothetical protein
LDVVAVNNSAIDVPFPVVEPNALVSTVVQPKLAPSTGDVRLMFVDVPEQIDCELGDAETVGVGLTAITTVIGFPTHVPILGVTVYDAVPDDVEIAYNVWFIEFPFPKTAPETPEADTLQLNVAPAGEDVKLMEVAVPEQIDCELGVAVTTGLEPILTTTLMGEPLQVL